VERLDKGFGRKEVGGLPLTHYYQIPWWVKDWGAIIRRAYWEGIGHLGDYWGLAGLVGLVWL